MPDARVARHSRDIAAAVEVDRTARAALDRLAALERRLRAVTRIYQERLDGHRNDER